MVKIKGKVCFLRFEENFLGFIITRYKTCFSVSMAKDRYADENKLNFMHQSFETGGREGLGDSRA